MKTPIYWRPISKMKILQQNGNKCPNLTKGNYPKQYFCDNFLPFFCHMTWIWKLWNSYELVYIAVIPLYYTPILQLYLSTTQHTQAVCNSCVGLQNTSPLGPWTQISHSRDSKFTSHLSRILLMIFFLFSQRSQLCSL